MLLSYNWIKKYLPKLNRSPEEVAESISRSLAEVESIQKIGTDTILEIKNIAISHRSDLFGEIGLAREVATVLDTPLELPTERQLDQLSGDLSTEPKIKIEIQDPKLCPRYTCAIIKNITVGESPQWLKDLLISVGMRPICNVVDVTNYLMFKYGQPLHAFDLDELQITDHVLSVHIRLAKPGEQLDLIDDSQMQLSENDLVVANEVNGKSHAIALAGIMGGKASEIKPTTRNILIESANFNMFQIRKSSRRLAVRSEASLRFEKGIDPEFSEMVLKDAILLITGSTDHSTITDEYPNQTKEQREIKLEVHRVNQYLNINLRAEKIQSILEHLGCQIQISGEEFKMAVPSFRQDLQNPEDIYEEIGRIYDYNQITPTLLTRSIQPPETNPMWDFKNQIRQMLLSSGSDEQLLYSFVREEQGGLISEIINGQVTLSPKYDKSLVHIKNTLSPELSYMRTSLLPSLIDATLENAKRFANFSIYEIGTVLEPNGNELPKEHNVLALIDYSQTQKPLDLIKQIKGRLRLLYEKLGVVEDSSIILPLLVNLGTTKGNAFGYELNLDHLLLQTKSPSFKNIPPHPQTKQDLSFIVSKNQPIGDIVQTIRNVPNLVDIELIDIFTSDKLIQNEQKSITLRLYFHNPEKSISDQEISPLRLAIEKVLREKFNAILR